MKNQNKTKLQGKKKTATANPKRWQDDRAFRVVSISLAITEAFALFQGGAWFAVLLFVISLVGLILMRKHSG